MARVLLAEPDKAIREFIGGILLEFGHDVQACDNGVDASVWLATVPIDFLVTDIVLQGSQGALLSQHSTALGIPTITLTGYEFRSDRDGGKLLSGLLEKPFRFADLRRIVRAIETGGSIGAPAAEAAAQAELARL
jgi:DNA-binding response OmpR family regulator